MLLQMQEDGLSRRQHDDRRAQQYFEDFKALVAARTDDPFKTLAALLKPSEQEPAEVFDEDSLPAPSPEQIADIQQWMAEHANGTATGADLGEGWM